MNDKTGQTQSVRARFAPSPTGFLHLGGARTALFSWAWARKCGGEFLLRVEDTDQTRSTRAHADAIIRALDWLGLNFDGEAMFQSQNKERHLQLASQLQESGAAYMDDGALRLRTPQDGEVFFDDLVCGRLAVENKELEDPVILRADKTPTYIFASAADDMTDQISHVIRGDDHVRNTHKQLHIYAALNKIPPHFAHLPMILSPDGERLSKRHAAVDIMQYAKDGFLPSAMVNFLARLSWSCKDAEVFDADFLIRHFDFNSVQRSPAKFDEKKLRWLNGEHIRELSYDHARKRICPDAGNQDLAQINFSADELSDAILDLILPRSETLADAREHAAYFLHRPRLSSELSDKHLNETAQAAIQDLREALSALPSGQWRADAIKSAMKETMRTHKIKFPQLGMPFRILLTAREQSPDIAQVAEVLGKEETLARMSE